MPHLGTETRLAAEAGTPRIVGRAGVQHLDGDRVAECEVLAAIDDALRAEADHFTGAKGPDHRAGRKTFDRAARSVFVGLIECSCLCRVHGSSPGPSALHPLFPPRMRSISR